MVGMRILSDLHLETGILNLPELPNEKHDILILAGDIANTCKPQQYDVVKSWVSRFRHTIYIMGNHEGYHSFWPYCIDDARDIFKDEIAAGQISILDDQIKEIDDVVFIGSTLWTSYYNHNPTLMWTAQQGLNDFRLIRTGPTSEPWKRKVSPNDFYTAHKKSEKFIFSSIEKYKAMEKKVVVVTHHGCSQQSIHYQYRGQDLNACYVSDLDQQIIDTKPDFWIHGHTHSSFRYKIGDTTVLVNPRGYAHHHTLGQENIDFDPLFRIDV